MHQFDCSHDNMDILTENGYRYYTCPDCNLEERVCLENNSNHSLSEDSMIDIKELLFN